MMHRREFLKTGLVGGVGAAAYLGLPFPLRAWASSHETAAADPHFFLQILLPEGVDHSYLFDARPLAMTQAGMIQNYLREEPVLWTGTNQGTAWTTSLVKVLEPYRQHFSILNGVHMSADFDGHLQNMNVFLTGSDFGGESFLPHLNVAPRFPLDAIQGGQFNADLTNTGSIVPLSLESATKLVSRIKQAEELGKDSPVARYLRGRYEALAKGGGLFSLGSARMGEGTRGIPELASIFRKIPDPTQGAGDDQEKFLGFVLNVFRERAAHSALLSLSVGAIDAHDSDNARAHPERVGRAARAVAAVFRKLQETPFDAHRSYLDVTTVMFSSEFGRTMRQVGRPIDATGTDHNPTGNSILIGGKGIQGGMIIGETDLRTAAETLSKAHLRFDTDKLKAIGRPFDFAKLKARTDLPGDYHVEDYLTIHSVVNTIYSLFKVPAERYRLLKREGAVAPVLEGLLKRT